MEFWNAAIGTLALAVIIFDGGMVTAGLTGVFAAWLLGLHWLQGMLIGERRRDPQVALMG